MRKRYLDGIPIETEAARIRDWNLLSRCEAVAAQSWWSICGRSCLMSVPRDRRNEQKQPIVFLWKSGGSDDSLTPDRRHWARRCRPWHLNPGGSKYTIRATPTTKDASGMSGQQRIQAS